MMRQPLIKTILYLLGISANGKKIHQRYGFDPLDLGTLIADKELYPFSLHRWTTICTRWVQLLCTRPMTEHIFNHRKTNPEYTPDITDFLTAIIQEEKLPNIIGSLDKLAHQTLNQPFPDDLIPGIPLTAGTFPAVAILTELLERKQTLDPKLLKLDLIQLGLTYTTKFSPDTIPGNLNKHDIHFLVDFLLFFQENPTWLDMLNDCLNDPAKSIIALAYIPPKRSSSSPIFSQADMIDRLNEVKDGLDLYEKDHAFVDRLLRK